jgi:hypothetical protein
MNSARVLAMVTSAEGSYGVITERGFCYSTTSQAPTIYDQTIVVSGTTLNEVYETTLTDLDQLTTYYVRPYAKNLVNWEERVGYGTAIEFTTSRFVSPQLSFINQSDVTVSTTSITLQAQIDNYYPTALQERGFIWSTDDKNISIDNAKSAGNYLTITSTDKVFSGTLTGLEPSTNYYIRAYAIYQASNEILTGLSDAVSYSTNDIVLGSFKDLTCTAKTTSSLTLNTGISDLGDGTLSEMGFVWRAGSGVAVTLDNCDGSQAVLSEDSYDYSVTITGLQQATGYTIRGYVKTLYNWETLIAYSDALYCETNDFTAATVKDITCTAQTIGSLTVESGINDLGNGTLVEKGFIYKNGNSGNPTLESFDGISKVEGTAQSNFSTTITGLTYSLEYRVRSYVKTTLDGKTQVSYSGTITAATSGLTSFTFKTSSCTNKTTSSLTVESGITDMGDGELTEKGFLWRVSDGVTPTLDNCDGSQASNDASNDSFSYTISSLQAGTSYSVRPYVKSTYNWETFICYGDVITCETNDFTAATIKDITCTAQTTTTLTVESGITDMGNGEFVEKGFVWRSGSSSTPTLDNCDGSMKVDGTDRSSFSATITGLQAGTSYRLRGYTKTILDGTTIVGYSDVITATTMDKVAATMSRISISLEDDCTIGMSSGINSMGTGELVEKGFCWKIDGSPTLEDCDGYKAVSGGSDESYSVSIEGLHYNSTYYVRSYAKTKIDGDTLVAYSSYNSLRTRSIDFNYSYTTGEDYIEIGMSCDNSFANKMTEWSAAIVKEGDNDEITLDDNSYTSAKKDSSTNLYVAKLTGLKINTTYVIRMRAKYNNDYYIYQNAWDISTLRDPSKEDIDNPVIK